MKKTSLIAAAIAATIAGSAFADTSMYGKMQIRMNSQEQLGQESGKLILGFKGEEDMGNGMTAFMKLELEHDGAEAEQVSNGWKNDHSFIGLKGDFGTVLFGNFSDFASWACGATDIFQKNTGKACSVGATNSRLSKSIAYQGGADAISYGIGARFNGSQTVEDDDGMDTVLAVKYNADAFQVAFQLTSPDEGDAIHVIGGYYMMGDMKLGANMGNDSNETAIGVALTMPMAGGSLKVGMDTGEDAGVADTTNVQFDKKLSKAVGVGTQYSSVDGVDDDTINFYINYAF